MEGAARTIDYAVLVSIALHGLVLTGFSAVHESRNLRASAPAPLEARLTEPEPVVVSAERKAVAKKSVSKPAPAPGPAPVIEAIQDVKSVPAPVAAAPRAEPASPPVDATTVGQYRLQLVDAAKRYKRYPEVARENNWAGNVVVGVAVGADARAQTSVRKSSGRMVLDQQALEMFQQAAKAVPVPPALRGREFSLEVRAIYGLED